MGYGKLITWIWEKVSDSTRQYLLCRAEFIISHLRHLKKKCRWIISFLWPPRMSRFMSATCFKWPHVKFNKVKNWINLHFMIKSSDSVRKFATWHLTSSYMTSKITSKICIKNLRINWINKFVKQNVLIINVIDKNLYIYIYITNMLLLNMVVHFFYIFFFKSRNFIGNWIIIGSVEDFRLCNLWSLVRSPVVEIIVYTADET